MIGHVIGEDYLSLIIKKKKHVRKKDGSNIKKKKLSAPNVVLRLRSPVLRNS